MTYDVITGEKMQKYKLFSVLIGILLITTAVFLFVVYPTNATTSKIASLSGQTYIKWNWTDDDNAISQISIDGGVNNYYNLTYNGTSQNFILSNLQPNSTHIIQIKDDISDTVFTTNEATTLNIVNNETNQERFFGIILPWVLFIVAVGFLIAGLYGVPFVSLIGGIICLYELVSSAANGSFIMDVLYICVIISSVLLARGEI